MIPGFVKLDKIRKELADGMKNVGYQEFHWGKRYTWENLPLVSYNVSMLTDQPDNKEWDEIVNWVRLDPYYKIAAHQGIDINDTSIPLIDQIDILKRKIKSVKAPFLPDFSIRSFSFDNRDLRIDYRKMTQAMANMLGETMTEKSQWERYIGAVLHMLNGKIWILENMDGSIIAAVLMGTTEPEEYWIIEAMSIVKALQNTELLENLVQSVLENYNGSDCYVFCRSESEENKIAKHLKFEEISTFRLSQ